MLRGSWVARENPELVSLSLRSEYPPVLQLKPGQGLDTDKLLLPEKTGLRTLQRQKTGSVSGFNTALSNINP
ncbi:hypothetical protein RRG08_015841 [Elysia crispata]|uniref:Uncharacterized protein n=1 Tax=Elysia crispata TaxID=231223 RepID=A0AAE1B0F2_9GAST|nr:hypothetical protein RRG08_015841 [Elysia crispata]